MKQNKQPDYEEETIEFEKDQTDFINKKKKNNLLALSIASLLAIIIIISGGYWIWNNYISSDAKESREITKQYKKTIKGIQNAEDAMRTDTYGGKTPQETLNIFIDALRKNDLELASKYFVLREDGTRDPQILENLKSKTPKIIADMINVFEKAKPTKSPIENGAGFLYEYNGQEYLIELQKNTYSKIWKIESL